jgi:DNA-binding SARP family transcriptional activator/tetratricopeptide (TPR) repeat protein
LLGLLLLEAGKSIPTERLVDLLWDADPPPTAVAALHTHMARLRKLLDPDATGSLGIRLATADQGYRADVDPESVDVHRFTTLVAEARRSSDPRRRAEFLRAALGLWRGELLEDCATDALRRRIGVDLAELRWATIEQAVETDLERGGHQDVIGELIALTEQNPWRERLWGLLALAYYRGDRQADALETLAKARTHLAEQLGLEPGAHLRRLHTRILHQDPALLADPNATTRGVAQLPMDIPHFVGRAAELRRLDDLAGATRTSTTPVVCVISGMGGVGKTKLAIRAAHRARQATTPNVQLWADLHGYHPDEPPAEPGVVLEAFLRVLGMPPHDIPAGLADRATEYRSRLSNQRVILLLDDAAEEDQVRPLLPGDGDALVLITSRHPLGGLDGAHLLPLDVFDATESVELIGHEAGQDRTTAEPADARRIADLCGHLPLAVALAARQLRTHQAWRLRHLAARLAQDDRRLTRLAAGDRSVRLTIDLSYQAVPPAHQQVLRLLPTHPGHDVTASSVAALAATSLRDADDILEALLDEHLLQQSIPGRYHLHDLVRLRADELAAASPDDDHPAALARLVEHYLSRAEQATLAIHPTETRRLPRAPTDSGLFTTPHQAAAWIDGEYTNLVATVHRAAAVDTCAQAAVHLVAALYRPLANSGHSTDRIELNQLAAQTAQQIGDRRGEAQAFEDLGVLCGQIGMTTEALTHSSRALQAWTELDDDIGKQVCLSDLGHIHHRLGADTEAISHLERSLAMAARTGYTTGEASTWNYLGLIEQHAGHYDRAITCHTRSTQLFADTGNTLGEAIATANHGWALQRAGRPVQAIDHHRNALATFEQLDDRYNTAEQHWALGQAHHALDDNQAARHHWDNAITVLTAIGLLDSTQAQQLHTQPVPDTPEIIRNNT